MSGRYSNQGPQVTHTAGTNSLKSCSFVHNGREIHSKRMHRVHKYASECKIVGAPIALLVIAMRSARSLDSEPEHVANMTARGAGMVATSASA